MIIMILNSDAGCPSTNCNGYELVVNLDFDRDGDGTFVEGSPWVIAMSLETIPIPMIL